MPHNERVLEALGLDMDSEQVYLLLVEQHPRSAAELAAAAAVSTARVRAAISRLEALGLATRSAGQPPRYQPTAPGVALETLALQRQREITSARQVAQELQKVFGSRHRGADEVVELVASPDQIKQRYVQLQQSAQREILNFDAPPYSLAPMDIEVELSRLAAGVRYRVIYSSEALDVPHRLASINQLIDAGQDARCLASVPIKLVVVDRRLALLPLQIEQSEALSGAIVVHQSSLLDMLVLVFDEHWRRATAIRAPTVAAGGSELTSTEQTLLAMLAAGQKDETVARQLGVTVRTVRRHVHELSERLDCHSRFQLALAAQRRGWL